MKVYLRKDLGNAGASNIPGELSKLDAAHTCSHMEAGVRTNTTWRIMGLSK